MDPLKHRWLTGALMFADTPDSEGGGTPPAPDGGSQAPEPPKPAEPKPAETVDFWKQKAREQESRAKANADAAKRLQQIEDAAKSEQQRAADALAKAQKDAADAVAEAVRYKAAAVHGVAGDDMDLIGGGDEQAVMARAERLGKLLAAERELEQMKAGQSAAPATGRPKPALRPGATPVEEVTRAGSVDAAREAALRRGRIENNTTIQQ